MSFFGSLFSGVSGLAAQSRSMSMIADNVANVNTTAYKGAAAQFASLVTRQPSSLTYSPGGVRSFTSYSIANQGLIQSSASPTDAAISGAGFFVVNSDPASAGEQLYTRAGSFSPDYIGNLRTPSGQFLQGWELDANERVVDVNTLTAVNVRIVNGLAAATTAVQLGANLDADYPPYAGVYAAGDMALHNASGGASGAQPASTRDVKVYDSLGRPTNITMAFLKDAATNTWRVELFGPAAALDATSHPNGLLASGTVAFNGDGSLASQNLTPRYPATALVGDPVGILWASSAGASTSSVSFDFGTVGSTDGLTQFASPNSVAYATQNGAEVGELNGFSIDEEGFVKASFTNGESRKLYRPADRHVRQSRGSGSTVRQCLRPDRRIG